MLHHTIDACTRTAMRDPLLRTKRRTPKGHLVWTGILVLGACVLLAMGAH